ncbi:MAG: proton-conducting transporter membrane subunit [Sandaracinaceae bacterium]
MGGLDPRALALLVLCAAPLSLFFVIAIVAVLGRKLPELVLGAAARVSLSASAITSLALVVVYLVDGRGPSTVSAGDWFSAGGGHFELVFLVDARSITFGALAASACGVVGAFSFRYLHKEPGYQRYFAQLALFSLGLTSVAFAGSAEVLFAGWELLGLSSALLVGFFHDRRAPVNNALRVFAAYRISDAAMLAAVALLHHWAHSGDLHALFGADPTYLDHAKLVVIGLLLLVAVAGKSALLPFSGWLPRAMEGPTPSSAIYYGALSIHAGCYLLLRVQPLIAQSILLEGVAVLAGASTAVYATFVGRAQADVKSMLSYAALAQVGLIVTEIALGFTTLAMVHLVGHACFRLLQFLLAPNILHDMSRVQVAPRRRGLSEGAYAAALFGGGLDALVERLFVRPFLAVMRRADRLDRTLSGAPDESRER